MLWAFVCMHRPHSSREWSSVPLVPVLLFSWSSLGLSVDEKLPTAFRLTKRGEGGKGTATNEGSQLAFHPKQPCRSSTWGSQKCRYRSKGRARVGRPTFAVRGGEVHDVGVHGEGVGGGRGQPARLRLRLRWRWRGRGMAGCELIHLRSLRPLDDGERGGRGLELASGCCCCCCLARGVPRVAVFLAGVAAVKLAPAAGGTSVIVGEDRLCVCVVGCLPQGRACLVWRARAGGIDPEVSGLLGVACLRSGHLIAVKAASLARRCPTTARTPRT